MKNIFQIFQFLENRDPIPLKIAEAFLISVEGIEIKSYLSLSVLSVGIEDFSTWVILLSGLAEQSTFFIRI